MNEDFYPGYYKDQYANCLLPYKPNTFTVKNMDNIGGYSTTLVKIWCDLNTQFDCTLFDNSIWQSRFTKPFDNAIWQHRMTMPIDNTIDIVI